MFMKTKNYTIKALTVLLSAITVLTSAVPSIFAEEVSESDKNNQSGKISKIVSTAGKVTLGAAFGFGALIGTLLLIKKINIEKMKNYYKQITKDVDSMTDEQVVKEIQDYEKNRIIEFTSNACDNSIIKSMRVFADETKFKGATDSLAKLKETEAKLNELGSKKSNGSEKTVAERYKEFDDEYGVNSLSDEWDAFFDDNDVRNYHSCKIDYDNMTRVHMSKYCTGCINDIEIDYKNFETNLNKLKGKYEKTKRKRKYLLIEIKMIHNLLDKYNNIKTDGEPIKIDIVDDFMPFESIVQNVFDASGPYKITFCGVCDEFDAENYTDKKFPPCEAQNAVGYIAARSFWFTMLQVYLKKNYCLTNALNNKNYLEKDFVFKPLVNELYRKVFPGITIEDKGLNEKLYALADIFAKLECTEPKGNDKECCDRLKKVIEDQFFK